MRFQRRVADAATAQLVAEAFKLYDEGEKGGLTRHELKCAMAFLTGAPPSPLELDALLPKSPPGQLDVPVLPFDDFSQAMLERLCAVDEVDEIRYAFRAFDTTFKGYISFDDVVRAFALAAPHLPQDKIRMAFDEIDTDRNGKVSWGDFERMMRYRGHLVDQTAPGSQPPYARRTQPAPAGARRAPASLHGTMQFATSAFDEPRELERETRPTYARHAAHSMAFTPSSHRW